MAPPYVTPLKKWLEKLVRKLARHYHPIQELWFPDESQILACLHGLVHVSGVMPMDTPRHVDSTMEQPWVGPSRTTSGRSWATTS